MKPIAEMLRSPSARPGPGHQVSERAELADFTPENGPLSAISGRFSGFFLYESETLRGPTPIALACPMYSDALACVRIDASVHIMRTNIEIDDKLMSDTLRLTGLKTKKEAVELGLRTLLRLRQQEALRRLKGKLQWEGDLGAMRTDE